MVKAQILVTIPSELTHVRFIGAAVRAMLGELACEPEQIAAVELCAVEAINNVIEHAYREEPGHTVQVQIAARDDELEVAVIDLGAAMPEGTLERAHAAHRAREARDADPHALLALGEVEEGGYGLGLIQQLMDHVQYQRDGAQNTLTMSMRLNGHALQARPELAD